MDQKPRATVHELEPNHRFAQIEIWVQAKMNGRVCDLRILFHDCGIVLRGYARTYYAKQLAQHAVMAESPLPILANEIEVC